jgi:membrane protease YdiL (CAAX protease family)
MEQAAPPHPPPLLRDPAFAAALLAAPVAWVALMVLGHPTAEAGWVLTSPGRWVVLGVVYPVLEEIVFRGGLQRWMKQHRFGNRRLAGLSTANWVASACFAAAHLYQHSIIWSAAVLVPSLLMGWLFDRHGRLTGPVLLHAFYNLGFFWIFGAPG